MFTAYLMLFCISFTTSVVGFVSNDFLQCPMQKCDETKSTTFKSGHTYVYSYSFEIKIDTREDKKEESNIVFNSEVEIYAGSNCNLILKLEDVKLFGEKHTVGETANLEEIIQSLQKSHLIFSFENGHITNICPSKTDLDWVINIKLGILSALQYKLENQTEEYTSTETNFMGECESIYKSGESHGWQIVRRKTDLSKCSYRTGHSKVLYNAFPDTSSLLKNSQRCRHVVGNSGEPILITCYENYTIQPFEEYSTQLQIKQQMDLDRVLWKSAPTYKDDSFQSLEFRQTFQLKDGFHETLEMPMINKLFSTFTDDRNKQKDNIVNILPLVFMSNPSIKTLKLIKLLLPQDKLWPQIQLTSSIILHYFCKNIPECQNVSEVSDIVKLLELPISEHFYLDKLEQFIVSLKSIGNSGVSYSMNKIVLLIQNTSLPTILRISAIDALRHMSCNYSRQAILTIFTNTGENPQIRIKALTSVMQCPSFDVINTISDVLHKESVNQVTRFTWGYIKAYYQKENANESGFIFNEVNEKKYSKLKKYLFNTLSSMNNELIIFNEHVNLESESFDIKLSTKLFDDAKNVIEIHGFFDGLQRFLKNTNDLTRKICLDKIDYNVNHKMNFDDNFIEKDNENSYGHIFLRISDFDMFYYNTSDLTMKLQQLVNEKLLVNLTFNAELEFLKASYELPTIVGLTLKSVINGKFIIKTNTTLINGEKDRCTVKPQSYTKLDVTTWISSLMKINFEGNEFSVMNNDELNNVAIVSQKVKYDKGKHAHLIMTGKTI